MLVSGSKKGFLPVISGEGRGKKAVLPAGATQADIH